MANKVGGPSPELLAAIDRDSAQPLHAQIERELRGHIRSGRLRPGDRLPSTRALAADLGVARGVVAEAFAQLRAEGRLVANRGGGTHVAARATGAEHGPSAAGGSDSGTPARPPIRFDLRLGIPDLALFPRRAWLAAYRHALAELPDGDLGYGDPAGLAALRGELAAYLGRVRAADATADSTVVTAGTVQGLALVCTVLRERGVRRVAVEQPGWAAQRAAVLGAGLEPVGLPVDDRGARVELLAGLDVGAVMLTPAHQFPTGAVLHPERRRLLAAWAVDRGALIVEDDYDAEYRYDRAAPGCLQGLAPAHTVYAGSTSKTLAPALRLGWLVAPPALAGPLSRAKLDADRCAPATTQAAFARLLAAGELDRHLRRTRPVYRERREALLDAFAEHLPELTPTGADAGLHAVAKLPPGVGEQAVVAAAAARGVALTGVRQDGGAGEPGLVLGYASLPADRIRAGIAELSRAVEAARHTR